MIEHYPEIHALHVAAALASGGMFLLRGAGLFAGRRWTRAAVLRRTTYVVDTVLLAAATALMFMLGQWPFVDAWLTAKILCVLLYIGLGVTAFRLGARRRPAGFACWLAALLVYGFIISVARSHDPLGLLAGVLG